MLSRQHKLLAAAVMASLALSACGKKKDVYGTPEAPPPVADGKGTPPTPGGGLPPAQDGDESDHTGLGGGLGGGQDGGKGGAQLPPPTSQGGSLKGPKQPPQPAPSQDEEEEHGAPQIPSQSEEEDESNVPAPPSLPKRPGSQPGAPTQPGPSQNPSQSGSYNPDSPKSLDIQSIEKKLTGGTGEGGIVYTSSSTDDIHNFLRARSQRVNEESRRLNAEASGSVLSANLTESAGVSTVTLRVREGEYTKVYQLAGRAAGPKGGALKVTAASTGTRPVDGTLACLDADGGCETSFARVRLGETGANGIINIIFRKSEAAVHFNLPKERSGSVDYENMREFILNTSRDVRTDNKIVDVRMSSWEITGGRAGVDLSLVGGNGEYIGYSVPLIARPEGTYVTTAATKIANTQGRKLAETVESARLIANNGLGQVRLAIKMKSRGGSAQDEFKVTFMRVMKPLIQLDEKNFK